MLILFFQMYRLSKYLNKCYRCLCCCMNTIEVSNINLNMKYNAQGNPVGEFFPYSSGGSISLVGKMLNAIRHIPGVKGFNPSQFHRLSDINVIDVFAVVNGFDISQIWVGFVVLGGRLGRCRFINY